jgi:hypothetical protein
MSTRPWRVSTCLAGACKRRRGLSETRAQAGSAQCDASHRPKCHAAEMQSPVEVAVDKYIRAWSERDPLARSSLLEACFAAEGRVVQRSGETRGRAGLAEMIERLSPIHNGSGCALPAPSMRSAPPSVFALFYRSARRYESRALRRWRDRRDGAHRIDFDVRRASGRRPAELALTRRWPRSSHARHRRRAHSGSGRIRPSCLPTNWLSARFSPRAFQGYRKRGCGAPGLPRCLAPDANPLHSTR